MAILTRLINLFPKYTSTPFEDFTTEAFVGLLEEDQNLLDKFVNQLLDIPGKDFKIQSQKFYNIHEYDNGVIDIVISNHDTVCFIENKVEASEGFNQLEKYFKILDAIAKNNYKTALAYCTKYLDEKPYNIRHNFKQIRWNDIYEFLEALNDNNPFINDFLTFLKANNMGVDTKITPKDVFLMENLYELILKLEEYLDIIRVEFQTVISNKISNPDNTLQLKRNNRYIIYKSNVIGNAWSEIGTGMDFNGNPHFIVWIWIHESNNKLKDVLERAKVFSGIEEVTSNGFIFRTPITNYINQGNCKETIKAWFSEKLQITKNFIDSTSELNWNLSAPSIQINGDVEEQLTPPPTTTPFS